MNDDYLNNLFREPAPKDTIRGPGLTREALKRMNDATDSVVTVTEPGEVIFDADGIPNGVAPSRTTQAFMGGAIITQGDANRLGLSPDEMATEYPNVRVIDVPNQKEN